MEPISSVINKIKWDKNENPDDYVIGYEDRVAGGIVEIKFAEIKRVDEGFMVLERDMEEVNIPLHRVRIVKKKGSIVWERKIKKPESKAHANP